MNGMVNGSDNEWLTLKEASEISGKSTSALRRLIQRGKIERVTKRSHERGVKWLIHKDEIELLNVHERQHVQGVHINRSEGVQVNAISFESFIEQQKEWERERVQIMNGLNMYRWKFEELDRKLKLLPAPVEVVKHEFEKIKFELDRKEESLFEASEKLNQVSGELEKIMGERKQLEDTLEKEQNARREIEGEWEDLSSQIDNLKALKRDAEEEKKKLEDDIEIIRNESVKKAVELESRLSAFQEEKEELLTVKSQVEERASRLEEEKGELEEKLKEEGEELKRLKEELEGERSKPWWKKLFGMK